MKKVIEVCQISGEGRDMNIIRQITDAIETVDGVKLLNVDPGKATNRTVVTFVGDEEGVVEAAFRAMSKAAELIRYEQAQRRASPIWCDGRMPLYPYR
jgi:glutamate formiminotransferase/formiminotetrahydrofolate cyclodeaminase